MSYRNLSSSFKFFKDPEAVKIYVLDANADWKMNEIAFKSFLKKTETCKIDKIWVFLNKFDLIQENDRTNTFQSMKLSLLDVAAEHRDLSLEIYPTSIWDNTLNLAFTEVIQSNCKFIKNLKALSERAYSELSLDQVPIKHENNHYQLIVFYSKTMSPLYMAQEKQNDKLLTESLSYIFKNYQASKR